MAALVLGGLQVAVAQTAYFCGDSTMAASGANDGATDGKLQILFHEIEDC